MKFIKKLFAGSVLAAAMATSHAAIITPSTGNSELIAILSSSNNSSLVVDLGITLSAFVADINNAKTFNLAASPYYTTFFGSPTVGTVTFTVFAADGAGGLVSPTGGDRALFLTSQLGTSPSPATNQLVSTRSGNANSFYTALNGGATVAGGFQNGHSVTNGSSFSPVSGATTSFSSLSASNLSPSGVVMTAVGGQAEAFTVVTSSDNGPDAAVITDFFSATETPTNVGGYFTFNAQTGALDYFGEPTVVNAIPEASEWAMMLSGLAMLGLMVRRRRNNV